MSGRSEREVDVGVPTLQRKPAEYWKRLGAWPRRVLIVLGLTVAATWVTVALFLFSAFANSPMQCSPTTGCPERKAGGCSCWASWSATSQVQCENDR